MTPIKSAFHILFGFLMSFSLIRAEASVWKEGKDHPKARVNQGLESITPQTFIHIAESVNASVVNISTESKAETVPGFGGPQDRRFHDFFGNDFFERFFGGPSPRQRNPRPQSSLGSGFIISEDGYLVTNNHVIEKADVITVTLTNKDEYKAKVIGRDPKTDVALLKIEAKSKLPTVIVGDSSKLKVGEIVVAIGNPFGLSHTVTQGIVSAKERSIRMGPYDDFIQTDASINPGNSGGPLLNIHGEVVGINTAIIASGQGIGFAIPMNLAKDIIGKLRKDGKVVRGWLGVMIQEVDKDIAKSLGLDKAAGALVADVQKGSPAEDSGLKAGDVITKYNGKTVQEWQNLPLLVAQTDVGKTVNVDFIRNGKKQSVKVKIGELKETEAAVAAGEPINREDKLGLSVEELTKEKARELGFGDEIEGVLVMSVNEESAASRRGLRPGDVILEVNQKKTTTLKQYEDAIASIQPKDSVLLLVQRRGQAPLFMAFTLP